MKDVNGEEARVKKLHVVVVDGWWESLFDDFRSIRSISSNTQENPNPVE